MASPPTSARLRWLDANGTVLTAPREWAPALIELDVDHATWDSVRLTRQEVPLPVSLRQIGGAIRVVADWPRSGPGHYRLHLTGPDGDDELTVTVRPSKISQASFQQLLADLETRLPVVIALGLQRAGGLAGIALTPPGQSTLAQELVRLRRAVHGVPGHRPGLAQVLTTLAPEPHLMLRGTEFWANRERARRPHPARLGQAAARPSNWDASLPLHVIDARVDPTPDVYENRLVAAFTLEVHSRLRHLTRVLGELHQSSLLEEALGLRQEMERARRQAAFLNDVSLPTYLPTRTTMVLLKRPPYRAALEGYLELHRSIAVRIEDPALVAPLENLPRLYQVWGTLQVLAALLDVAPIHDFTVRHERLTGRDWTGLFVRVLPDGQPAVTLDRNDGCTVKFIPERTYGQSGELRSISYGQRPDIAVEVRQPGAPPRVLIFDPKYKLDGDLMSDTPGPGRPTKTDIDAMHAYRDAIRDQTLRHVVSYAAILYPGPEVSFSGGVGTLTAYPGAATTLERRLRDILSDALAPH